MVAWRRFGQGPEAVVCFHGYGESSRSFAFLDKHAGNQYSFYTIDLPYHGDTVWNESAFSESDLLEIIDRICPSTRFTVLGFSLGGRVGLSLFETRPANINRVVLLAPDGLKVNFWYWLATQTMAGKSLFRFTMKNPGWFFGLLRLFNFFGIVNASVFKFVRYYIGDPPLRELLYHRWISLRKLRPDLNQVKRLATEFKTPFTLVYGKHDRIILPVVGRRFRKGIEAYCEVTEIASGHQVLHEKHVRDILHALQGSRH